MIHITNEPVVVLALPHGSRSLQQFVNFMAGKRLPCVDNLGERPALPGLDHRVDMVGHDAPGDEGVALLVEVKKGVLDDGGGLWVAQKAGAMTCVEVLFDAATFFEKAFAFFKMQ